MKTVEYFMIPSSPWTYLGHARLGEIAKQHGARIVMKPFDLGQVFPVSGGLPLPKRAPQRQAYRLQELARWRDHLGVALTIEPRFFPVAADLALKFLISVQQLHDEQTAFDVAQSVMAATWAEEKDISDPVTLSGIAGGHGLDADALLANTDKTEQTLAANTKEAIDTQVFGSPWYRVDGENFWGQDRLDFVERRLAG